ncbi:hypothetical protein [Rathayibacter soli]|uniref:hypothetical protein n=1 Tax=Rathayibacter soli TaxID=3144168 RepID=UPI0027E4FFF8|nr:hypothetical protein [Glaciibacter superstes]
MRIIHSVVQAVAATSRTSLDLLALPFPFSQVALLDPEQFAKAAKERRITMWGGRDLDLSGLEELHRRGVLVPMFCVSIDDADPSRRRDTSASLTPKHVHSTVVSELYRAAQEGRVMDPGAEDFEQWPHERVRASWPSVARGYLYSQHQLLGLERARSLASSLRPTLIANRLVVHLDEVDVPDQHALSACASWRSLAITLSALDTRAWPHITRMIAGSETWRSTTLSQPPQELLGWLGLTVKEVHRQAELLRSSASFDDVLGDFYDLIRRANPKTWETLQGDARTAMDSRMAAEVLDLFAHELTDDEDDLASAGSEHLSMQGLSVREPSIDRVLTSLQLSPHPPLVLAVEGQTEMLIIPRVMALLGMKVDPTWIRLVNFGGTKKDLSLLAGYASSPALGSDHGQFVMLDRPVTRFLVLTDAENKYETRADRQHQRKLLLDSIAATLPGDLRPDLYTRGARIVEIITWGRLPWEFAHFSDAQLADSLIKAAGKPHPAGRDRLIADIHQQRTKDPTPDIDDAWRKSGVSKPELADALWPILEARIERAITRGTLGPPVMKAALRAYELANLSYGLNVSVKRHCVREHHK